MVHTKQFSLQELLVLDGYLEQLYESKHLSERDVLQLCEMARAIVSEESNVHSVRCPVTVVGVEPRRVKLNPRQSAVSADTSDEVYYASAGS